MGSAIQLTLGGTPVSSDFYRTIETLEVEENADRPDALLLRVPVNRTASGDLQYVGDGTFEPYTNITLTVTPPGQGAQCIFDGFALSWKLHLDRAGLCSTLEIWAQDASWLMNIADTVQEWPGMTDGQVANEIFSSYGFTPHPANTAEDSPVHDPDQHSLFQRASDLQFLRGLARRAGKLCRVACTDTPGQRTGYFITPNTTGTAALTITLADPNAWSVDALDFEWDVMRPTEVDASQLPLDSAADAGTPGNATESGIAALAASATPTRDYASYANVPALPAGAPATLLLTPTADVAEVPQRTTAALRDASWFMRATGEADVLRLGNVLRVGTVVALAGAGALQSGNWLVWSVRHTVTLDSVTLHFTLVRNAIGAAPSAAGGGLSLPGGV
jgi:phage protein D